METGVPSPRSPARLLGLSVTLLLFLGYCPSVQPSLEPCQQEVSRGCCPPLAKSHHWFLEAKTQLQLAHPSKLLLLNH